MRMRYSTTSPFARKVLIALHELKMAHRVALLRTNPREDVEALRATNPLGKIPVFITDDGMTLYDSNVICEYIDDEFGGTLFPESSARRWAALTMGALGDGLMEAGMLFRAELAREKAQQSADALEWQRGKIDAALSKLDEVVPGLDAEFTIGVVSCLCAVGYIEFRLADHDFTAQRKNIRSWFDEMSKRPSVAATVPRLS